MKKRRSDIQKLVSASRDVWRQSEIYGEVKKESKDPSRSGWFICRSCQTSREVIKIDHIKGIGRQPDGLADFGSWLPALFCFKANLQPLCADCHSAKTKTDKLKKAAAADSLEAG